MSKAAEQPFNGLSHAEAERLALLAEECGEVIQVIGKILRHGYESYHPNGARSNRELLEGELGDVAAAMTLLGRAFDVRLDLVSMHEENKLGRVGRRKEIAMVDTKAIRETVADLTALWGPGSAKLLECADEIDRLRAVVAKLPKCFGYKCAKTATHIAEWHPPRFYCDDCEADGVDEGKDELPYAAELREIGL